MFWARFSGASKASGGLRPQRDDRRNTLGQHRPGGNLGRFGKDRDQQHDVTLQVIFGPVLAPGGVQPLLFCMQPGQGRARARPACTSRRGRRNSGWPARGSKAITLLIIVMVCPPGHLTGLKYVQPMGVLRKPR